MKRSVVGGLMDFIAGIISLCAVFALVMSYITPFINPNTTWIFTFFGLFAPIIYITNIILVLYWACRWSPMFFFIAIPLLFGIGKITTYYQPSLSKKYVEQSKSSSEISIFSFNVQGFLDIDDEGKHFSTAREITNYINERNPDIICLQEYQTTKTFSKRKIDEALKDWKYRVLNLHFQNIMGSAIYSKYPIISSGTLDFDASNNGVGYANILIGKNDTLRVINNHLETTYIDRRSVEFLENKIDGKDKEEEIKKIGGRLRKGFIKRAAQADSVAVLINRSTLPTIVCGDFNDTPISYVYRTIRGDLEDTFENKGTGFGYTYKKLYGVLRIDYIFHTPDMETVSYESPRVKWSDHNPVTAKIKKAGK